MFGLKTDGIFSFDDAAKAASTAGKWKTRIFKLSSLAANWDDLYDAAGELSLIEILLRVISPQAQITPLGGFAVRVYNNTGSTLPKGYVVKPDSATDDAVVLTAASDADPIGIVYEDILDDSWGLIVINGIADGYVDNVGAVTREQWVGVSTANAGQMTASGIPTGTGDHFRECGHTLRERTGAGLVRMIVHFN